MSPEIIGLWMIGALLTGIFVGFPIAFTLIILGILFGYAGFGDTVFHLMVFQFFQVMREQTLASVPLFVKNDFESLPGVICASFSARSDCGALT